MRLKPRHYTRPILKQLRRTIGENIKRMRMDQSFSLADFAARIRVPVDKLSSYEEGTKEVPLHIMVRMAYELKVPVKAVFDGI